MGQALAVALPESEAVAVVVALPDTVAEAVAMDVAVAEAEAEAEARGARTLSSMEPPRLNVGLREQPLMNADRYYVSPPMRP